MYSCRNLSLLLKYFILNLILLSLYLSANIFYIKKRRVSTLILRGKVCAILLRTLENYLNKSRIINLMKIKEILVFIKTFLSMNIAYEYSMF
jgi:hypothetical protein